MDNATNSYLFLLWCHFTNGRLTLANNLEVTNLSEIQRTECLLACDSICKKSYHCYQNLWLCNILLAKMIDYRNYYSIKEEEIGVHLFLKDRFCFLFVRVGKVMSFSCWKERKDLYSSSATALHAASEQPVISWWCLRHIHMILLIF